MIKDCSCNLIKTLLNRWGTWITAGLYYSRNYEEVKNIVLNWDGDGLIVKNAKKAISSETLTQSLVLLQQNAKLPELITKIEGDKVSIVTCHQIISDFILELQSDDPIRTYLVNRLENMQDLMDIISCTTGLSPEKTAKLRGAVGSSASIERSFSKLGKLLAKDRNFNAKNVEAYICVYCNNL